MTDKQKNDECLSACTALARIDEQVQTLKKSDSLQWKEVNQLKRMAVIILTTLSLTLATAIVNLCIVLANKR